jgi:hypothetical protein
MLLYFPCRDFGCNHAAVSVLAVFSNQSLGSGQNTVPSGICHFPHPQITCPAYCGFGFLHFDFFAQIHEKIGLPSNEERRLPQKLAGFLLRMNNQERFFTSGVDGTQGKNAYFRKNNIHG